MPTVLKYKKMEMTINKSGIRRGAGLISCLFFVPFVLLAGLLSSCQRPYKNYVVMVSFDAFRWDYESIYPTPNIDELTEKGVMAEKLIPCFPSNTFPNHYAIATGLYPDHHGIVNNSFYAPDLGLSYRISDRTAVENPNFYKGEPLWVTAIKQGRIAASFFWVGSEAPVSGMHPTYWKIYDESITYGERIDTVVKWLMYPKGRRPQLITLYFDEPDATSHDYGPVAPETGKVVARLDSLLGVLRNKLSSLPYGKRINLILLSDHGMSQVSSEKYNNIRDIVPERMMNSISGGNPVYMIEPSNSKSDSILLLINKTPGVKAWKKENLPPEWHYGTNPRISEIVVVADSGWYLSMRQNTKEFTGGAHGYDNMNSDMAGIFHATGPAFKKGYIIDRLDNIDIYNLVCRILDLKPAINDGDPYHITGLLK